MHKELKQNKYKIPNSVRKTFYQLDGLKQNAENVPTDKFKTKCYK